MIDIPDSFASINQLEEAMAKGDVSIGIFMPPDFEYRMQSKDIPIARLLFDVPARNDLVDFYLGVGLFVISPLTLALLVLSTLRLQKRLD